MVESERFYYMIATFPHPLTFHNNSKLRSRWVSLTTKIKTGMSMYRAAGGCPWSYGGDVGTGSDTL